MSILYWSFFPSSVYKLYSVARKPAAWLIRKGELWCIRLALSQVPPPHVWCRGDASQGMNIKEALKEVLRNALINDGLSRGLREGVKALDK